MYSDETKTCSICGKEFTGWGNNPWPVTEDGECCDDCNMYYVVPERMRLWGKSLFGEDYEESEAK